MSKIGSRMRTGGGWRVRTVGIALAIVWTAAIVVLSVQYLKIFDKDAAWTDALVKLVPILLMLLAAGWFYRSMTRPPLRRGEEERREEGGRSAILFVHGMGVQDRHQMLHEIANALPDFTDRYANKIEIHQRHVSSPYIPLEVEYDDNRRKYVDVHEAYWGSLFNGLASLQKTIIFSVFTLFKFIPTIFTRVFRKRFAETLYVGVALAGLYCVIAIVYSGFVISTNRLERLHYIGREAGVEQLPQRVKNLDVGYERAIPAGEGAAATMENVPSPDFLKAGSGIGILHKRGELMPDGSRDHGFHVDINGQQADAPTYDQRYKDFNRFFVASFKRAFTFDKVWSQPVSIELPKKQLETVPGQYLVLSLVFSVAYGFLLLSACKFFAAQWKFLISGRGPKHNRRYNARTNNEWVKATWGALANGSVPLIMILALAPNLDLLLVQFMATAVLLVLTLKGLAWWVVNYMGDVKIYATMKATEQTAEARQEATDLVADKITDLLRDARYDRVIVLAHSLGSVIGTNAVRTVHKNKHICNVIRAKSHKSQEDEAFLAKHDIDFYKLTAHVTIGSPLRKFEQLFKGRPYQRIFGSNTVENDSMIFYNYRYPEQASVVWFNYWYYSDIFADRLAHMPIGRLRTELAHRNRHMRVLDGIVESLNTEHADDQTDQAEKNNSPLSFRDLDTTGFYITEKHDGFLGFRPGIWTHSDYWLDHNFVDDLLDMTKQNDLREMKAYSKS